MFVLHYHSLIHHQNFHHTSFHPSRLLHLSHCHYLPFILVFLHKFLICIFIRIIIFLLTLIAILSVSIFIRVFSILIAVLKVIRFPTWMSYEDFRRDGKKYSLSQLVVPQKRELLSATKLRGQLCTKYLNVITILQLNFQFYILRFFI
jgi:hypothetical protein